MEVESGNEALVRIASGAAVSRAEWPALRADITAQLDKIAHTAFPIPILPPPPPLPPRLASPMASSPCARVAATAKPLEPAELLPRQIGDLLAAIKSQLASFTTYAPHTIQRLAELILRPHAHYKALTSYLHALDRVVQVTSGTNVYPLPPVVPDMSAMVRLTGSSGSAVNSDDSDDPAVVASRSTDPAASASALGLDDALGGAVLTPIPWLTRRSSDSGDEVPGAAQIHSEGTETIDGPNGMGSIETVSVSVNGVPSTGHARDATQGELLRQEQHAGAFDGDEDRGINDDDDDYDDGEGGIGDDTEAEAGESGGGADVPHARGPEDIGVIDTGPQMAATNGSTQDTDATPAAGCRPRRIDDPGSAPALALTASAVGMDGDGAIADARHSPPSTLKREAAAAADDTLAAAPPKKVRETLDATADAENARSQQDDRMDET